VWVKEEKVGQSGSGIRKEARKDEDEVAKACCRSVKPKMEKQQKREPKAPLKEKIFYGFRT